MFHRIACTPTIGETHQQVVSLKLSCIDAQLCHCCESGAFLLAWPAVEATWVVLMSPKRARQSVVPLISRAPERERPKIGSAQSVVWPRLALQPANSVRCVLCHGVTSDA
jgi:hypothetical protein